MLLTELSAVEKNGGKKTVAITVAVVAHVILFLIFMLVKIINNNKEEPELIAKVTAVAKEEQPKMQKKTVMKQVKQAASASAASPISKMLRANTTARIVAPKVDRVTDGPLGLGEGDFGDGFGSGSGNGMGSGTTMFGSAGSGGGLTGRLFDLKKNREKGPRAYNQDQDFYPVISKLIDRKFSDKMLDDYYLASVKLGFTFLAIPNMDANEGPKAFQAEKEIQPRGWFVHYSGKMDPPEEGMYRFHGMFDDLLIVLVNGKPVLDACWADCLNESSLRGQSSQPTFMSGKPTWQGKWVTIKRGTEITILVGERPGGRLGGTLMVEQKGAKYNKRSNGSPILPLFTTTKLRDKEWDLINQTGYEYDRNPPIFTPGKVRMGF